jgi:hypothetical protein
MSLAFIDLAGMIGRIVSGETEMPKGNNPDRVSFIALRIAYPTGWLYRVQAAIYYFHQEIARPVFDPEQQRVFPEMLETGRRRRISATLPFDPLTRIYVLPWLEQILLSTAQSAAFLQTRIDQVLLACALERFRLANGQFPDHLAALVPRFIEMIPHDVMNGKPLKYRRMDDGQFALYSVGWNGVDDGGIDSSVMPANNPDLGFSHAGDISIKDWVWHSGLKP